MHFLEILPKKNEKLLQQIEFTTVCSVKKFTQALKILHKLGLCGLSHFASLQPVWMTIMIMHMPLLQV